MTARGGVRTAARGAWALLLAAAMARGADAPAFAEYQVKAAFLYNFAKLVTWPAATLPPKTTLSLCLFGDDPFGLAREAFDGKRIEGRQLAVRPVAAAANLADCHIVFIPASRTDAVADVVARTGNSPILTVGEGAGVAERGVVINFFRDGEQLRFEVNLDAARRSQLVISSRLLNLARITHDAVGAP